MKPNAKFNFLFRLPASLRGASWFSSTNELLLRFAKSLQATKQSSFTNWPLRGFYKYWKRLFTTNSEQFEVENPQALLDKPLPGFSTSKDCFVEAVTVSLVKLTFQFRLRLAMTKCSDNGLNCNFTLLTEFCEG
jgi:hypothetical protein